MTRIDEIRQRLEKATPGPWVVGDEPSQVIAPCPCCGLIATCEPYGLPTGDRDYDSKHHYNSDLIANAPADLAYLLERLAKAEAALANTSRTESMDGTEFCSECGEYPDQHGAECSVAEWETHSE